MFYLVVNLASGGGNITYIDLYLHCSDPDAPGGTPVMQQTQVEWQFYLPYNFIKKIITNAIYGGKEHDISPLGVYGLSFAIYFCTQSLWFDSQYPLNIFFLPYRRTSL
jgi:hypothetical protein